MVLREDFQDYPDVKHKIGINTTKEIMSGVKCVTIISCVAQRRTRKDYLLKLIVFVNFNICPTRHQFNLYVEGQNANG